MPGTSKPVDARSKTRSPKAAWLAALIAAGVIIVVIVVVFGGGGTDTPQPARMLRKMKLSTPQTLPEGSPQPVVPVQDGRVDRGNAPPTTTQPSPTQQASSEAPVFNELTALGMSREWGPPPGTQDPFTTRAVRLALRVGADPERRVSAWWSSATGPNALAGAPRRIEDVTVTLLRRNADGTYTASVSLLVLKPDVAEYEPPIDLGEQTFSIER